MKKRYMVLYLALSLLFISGCSDNKEVKEPTHAEEREEADTSEQDPAPETTKEDVFEENTNISEPAGETQQETEAESRSVTVYYVDEGSGVVVGKAAEIQDEYDIWDVLKDSGILTEECELNHIKLNENQTMELDFNHATAERINSMGTTGETEIIGCIVNTYLDAYECTGIRLLEEGQDFVSSHGAEFSEYPGRIEFR